MPVEIIAEAAQGYEGDPLLTRLLARGALRAGADAVKFQLVYADELATPDYQYYQLFQSLEMLPAEWETVIREVRDAGRRFYFDVFGEQGLKEARALGVDGVKIHSTDFFNESLIRQALELMPRVFISFGGITVEELEAFVHRHRLSPSETLCFMYGFQADPTPIASNNLRRLSALRARFPGFRFGFMDHTDGADETALTLPLLALPLGVACIEKHISLDRSLQLEDYVSALSPESFASFVQTIRRVEPALGTEQLELSTAERDYRRKAVKAVVAHRTLKQGQVMTAADLRLKRAGATGGPQSIHQLDEAVGRSVVVDVQPNQPLTKEMIR